MNGHELTPSKLAKEVALLPYKDKEIFVREFFENLTPKQKVKLLEKAFVICYGKKYQEIDAQLEKYFENDLSLTPYVAAYKVRYYFKIPEKMMPLLIKLAQKVKNRVVNRVRYRIKKQKKKRGEKVD